MNRRKQKGMVLILAMLIVVLVVSITVSLSWRYNLSLTRSENRWHGLQARAYLEGAETLASVVLVQDFQQDQERGGLMDSADEFWAQPSDAFPTDEGWVQGQLQDAQARFNINLLQDAAPALQGNQPAASVPLEQRFTPSQKRFIRLLQTLELEDGPMDEARAMEITEAIKDWIDHDQALTGFGGAEADYYQQLEPPTTPPNREMVSVSELSRIRGMTPEIYTQLLPLVIALPKTALLNINTMSLPLMRTMTGGNNFAPLAPEDAQLLMDEMRGAGEGGAGVPAAQNGMGQATPAGYDDLQEFAASPILTDLVNGTGSFDTAGLTVYSNYFLLFSETQVGEQVRAGASMLRRDDQGQVLVVRRSDANF